MLGPKELNFAAILESVKGELSQHGITGDIDRASTAMNMDAAKETLQKATSRVEEVAETVLASAKGSSAISAEQLAKNTTPDQAVRT